MEAVGRYFCCGRHFVYDSIRKNAGNTLVGFSGCFGRQLLWSIKELKEQEKKSGKRMVPEAEGG